jgi:hypothetical protein
MPSIRRVVILITAATLAGTPLMLCAQGVGIDPPMKALDAIASATVAR